MQKKPVVALNLLFRSVTDAAEYMSLQEGYTRAQIREGHRVIERNRNRINYYCRKDNVAGFYWADPDDAAAMFVNVGPMVKFVTLT